jgi:hypothetical protein
MKVQSVCSSEVPWRSKEEKAGMGASLNKKVGAHFVFVGGNTDHYPY